MRILLLLALIATPTLAADPTNEWAKLDSSGTVISVIVADPGHIQGRKDKTWVKTPKKVGIGWTYDGAQFSPPLVEISSDTKVIPWTPY